MKEQHKWSDFPGFSVLSDPDTGKWVALLMRQWDSDIGEELEFCDIKCGRSVLESSPAPYLSASLRMHGPKWTGVRLGESTDRDVVLHLLDMAVISGKTQGSTIILDDRRSGDSAASVKTYADTPLFTAGAKDASGDTRPSGMPEMIREMHDLYEYGDGSFIQKCRNFYTQGMFMRGYEDDSPWYGDLRRYFPTYHDLNLRQLRGYFTWRTHIRKGEFQRTCPSFAYIYLYELLNGIGTSSPEESFMKMEAFRKGYLDTGMGDMSMKRDLRRWMLEFAVIYGFPAETAGKYAAPGTRELDEALLILRDPGAKTDDEVSGAMMRFASPRTASSPVIKKCGERGCHLFAEIWRKSVNAHVHGLGDESDRRNLFEVCFGKTDTEPWHPLANAVYLELRDLEERTYDFDGCRKYAFKDGAWTMTRIDSLSAEKDAFLYFVHAADLRLRKLLGTGHPLREKKNEAWAYAIIDTALAEIRQEEIEASRPKVSIDFSGLDRIREDAGVTRDSLLTEDELPETPIETSDFAISAAPAEEEEFTDDDTPDISGGMGAQTLPEGLDWVQFDILNALLKGNDPGGLIRDGKLMPSVVCDSINEALFDEIGDNVMECENDSLSLVEDYIEDLELLIGGDR